ncbi:type II toxin-antitoxin system PemK/MazF family toxin [Natrialba swarupiae]|uniref:Type II toxin-antitoxin system PemK/MazF family toxin n=1 Tax=Natrialba swarupiae TaxID=2448032 RepID=A0A5D5AID3_9EURY|nr:type II toxin-antitoxin system PemK/MazF family toxin [Natrialba swarupiae]TYT60683.1 type II toxin-antitoxin system PemK/MazF family toxin [Natrialba swarupiae]
MSEDSEIRRGGVVIVRLDPAEGNEISKCWSSEMKNTRPAVVVQNDVGNKNASTTIVAPATGTYRGYPFEVLVEAAESPFEKDSSVRLDQIRVVSIEKRVHSVLGSLDTETMKAVDEALKLSFGLN